MSNLVLCTEQVCPNTFEDTILPVTRYKARAATVYFNLCGATMPCLTNQAEIQAACDAGTFKIFTCGKVTPGEPTANTVTDDFGCSDSEVVQDYTHTGDFYLNWTPENDAFWKQICAGQYDDFGWVCCDGRTWVPGVRPEVQVKSPVDEGGFKRVKGTWNFTQDCGIVDSVPGRSPLTADCCV